MDKYNKYEWIPISYKEAIDKISTNNKKIKQKEYISNGKYPVIDQGQEFIGGFTNDESKLLNCTLPALVFGDHTKIVKLVNYKFAPGADGVKVGVPRKFFNAKLFEFFTKILALKIPDKGYARHFQYIEKSKIPLPPLPEQRAIVSKIEQLFSELDNGIENFKKAEEQLKIYRQAVLKKAFEGELTKKWREKQTDLHSSNILIEQIERTHHKKRNDLKLITEEEKKILAELPETWTWGRLGNLVNQIVVGYVGPITKHFTDDENNGVRLLSTTHIGEKKFLNNKEIRFVTKSFSEKNKKSEVKSGDILVARHGDSGKCCIIPENIQMAQVSNVVVIRPDNKAVLNKFLIYSFRFLKQELQKKKVGGVQQVVNTKTMEAFPFPFCSLKEQNQIVIEIETRLSVCDKMETTIVESLQKAESLRQSILKKAFDGKLLSEKELEEARNAPDWEPAEKLLERIKAERTNTKRKKWIKND